MVLVTGASSLVGDALARRLLGNGHSVTGLDFWKNRDWPDNADFIEGNVLQHELLLDVFGEIDTVYHLMDIETPSHFGRRYMRKLNVKGTENVIKAAVEKGIKKIIYLSSAQVYGNPGTMPIRYDDAKKPITPYGRDKLKAEKLLWKEIKHGALDITIFRPTIIVGAGIDDPLILIILYMALAMGESNRMYIAGDGDSMFQLVHHADVVDALIKAMDNRHSKGRIYNLGSDNVLTQLEQVVKVKEAARLDCHIKHITRFFTKLFSFALRPFNINYLTKEHVIFLLSNFFMDCEKAKVELKWMPMKSNVEILVEAIEWYKKEKL